MHPKAALCVPTYKRPECVEDFLTHCAKYYLENGIDIYYFDTSPDEKTAMAVQSFNQRSGTEVYYVRMPDELDRGDYKAFKIFQLYGMKKEYDFLWLCNDVMQLSEKAVAQIAAKLDVKYDIVEADTWDMDNLGEKVYTEHSMYLKECGWKVGQFGEVLLNTRTLLGGVDWKYYWDECLQKDVISLSNTYFYFLRLAEMGRFQALHLSISNREAKNSVYRKSSGWLGQTFEVICEHWVNCVERLPDCYMEKEAAILNMGAHGRFKDKKAFLKLKGDGVYNFNVFWKYRKKWRILTPVSLPSLFLAALVPEAMAGHIFRRETVKSLNSVKKFSNMFPSLVLYGDGVKAYEVASFFECAGLTFDYFCVTRVREDKTEYFGHPVRALDESCDDLQTKGIIMCMRKECVDEVFPVLRKYGLEQNSYFDPGLFDAASYSLGYR